MPRACGRCGKAGAALRCSRCKVAWYCDADCQRAAWGGHKGECSAGGAAGPTRASVAGRASDARTGAAAGAGAAVLSAEPAALLRAMADERSVLETRGRQYLSQLRDAIRSPDAAGSVVLDGVFKRMLDKREFQKIVFPGVTVAEDAPYPKSLQELVCVPGYAAELERLVPAATARATSVLEGVKRKGAAAGQIMDAATEATLWPQVLNEAFAREICSLVQRMSKAAHAQYAASESTLASVDAPQAAWEQMSEAAVRAIVDDSQGYAVLDNFLGPEWIDIVSDDLERFCEGGRLQRPVAGQGALVWVEPREIQADYAGLYECLDRLAGIPFELNRKRPQLKLHLVGPGSILLSRYARGDSHPLRLDSGNGAPAAVAESF